MFHVLSYIYLAGLCTFDFTSRMLRCHIVSYWGHGAGGLVEKTGGNIPLQCSQTYLPPILAETHVRTAFHLAPEMRHVDIEAFSAGGEEVVNFMKCLLFAKHVIAIAEGQ